MVIAINAKNAKLFITKNGLKKIQKKNKYIKKKIFQDLMLGAKNGVLKILKKLKREMQNIIKKIQKKLKKKNKYIEKKILKLFLLQDTVIEH